MGPLWFGLGPFWTRLEKLFIPGSFLKPGRCMGKPVLLPAHGVQPAIARCCVVHGTCNLTEVSLEERTVALADKLWKAKREGDLELLVIEETAGRLGVSRWDVLVRPDNVFEEIAADGADRLQVSRQGR